MKSYLITDPAYYDDREQFRTYLHTVFQKEPDYLLFRDKITDERELLARIFLKEAARFSLPRTLMSEHIDLAQELGFFGVHLTSKQFDQIAAAKRAELFTVVSTHTLEEARLAESEGVDAVTISPIFPSPGKGEGRGIDFLCKVCNALRHSRIFALGGIVSEAEIAAVSRCRPYGFASIRYFI